ncbi:MAG: hypothetical protein GY870_00185 [archaeon]|nr:hypothetical protein [archaeon]
MSEQVMSFKQITEHIFSVFNTYVFLNLDEISFEDKPLKAQERLIKALNENPIKINNKFRIFWKIESAKQLKISKGVYSPVSKEDSFIMGILVEDQIFHSNDPKSIKPVNEASLTIGEVITEDIPSNTLSFINTRFYIHTSGVGTCRTEISIEKPNSESIDILKLEQISEKLNELYRKYFADVCYDIVKKLHEAVRVWDIPHYEFEFIPKVLKLTESEKMTYILPWTHRLYEIQDDRLLQMDNPGMQFRTLLTPSKKMDIEDFSIYENRWIYFGWGHSIIFTPSDISGSGYSQTNKLPRDYARLIEIAQNNWRAIEMIDNLLNYAITYYNLHFKNMRLKDIRFKIYEIRDFNKAVDRIMDNFRGVKISFDTENRILLDELNDRWLTSEMLEKLKDRQEMLENLLSDLFQRQQEKKDDSLNSIVMLFTIISLFDVFSVFFDILTQGMAINWIAQLLILISGTLSLGMLIILYVRLAEKN